MRHLGNDECSFANAIQFCLSRKSAGSVRQILQSCLEGVVHESDMAKMFKESLMDVGRAHPRILLEALEDQRFLLPVAFVHVSYSSVSDILFES